MTDPSLIAPQGFSDIVTVKDPQVSANGDWIAFVQVSVDRVENTNLF